MSSPGQPKSPAFLKPALLGLFVSLVALLPWWHNHDYLRDFYDYGLFINVNARLAEGQHPYVDFTTPAQSAAFLCNYAAERLGGGTFVGMTYGAAAIILLAGVGFTLLLSRRMNAWAAALVSLAIVAGSASQHTIAFYNPLGVVATALTVWAFAAAPMLRRETWAWHALAAAGLLLGGLNKINFHLLACAMAAGWVILAWIARRASPRRALASLAFIALFGAVLPVAVEIAWTGASWREWYYNIVELPLAARGARIDLLFSPQLYLKTLHPYYGTLRVPPIGLIGVLMPLCAVLAAWRQPSAPAAPWRKAFLVLAGLLAALASSALLLTNNEIAYVTFATALAISAALWIGFGLRQRGVWYVAGLLLPALVLAAAGWESAWRGQRSQFGHDPHRREEYRAGETAGPAFRYLTGLQLPPGMAASLSDIAAWRDSLPAGQRTGIYYGPGAEWLEHVWPVNKVKGLPLVAAAFDGERENRLLETQVIAGHTFEYLLVVEAWDYWNGAVQRMLEQTAVKSYLGTSFVLYRKLPAGTLSAEPLVALNNGLGSNADSMRVISDLTLRPLPDKRLFLGTDHGDGRIDVNTPCHRIAATYVLQRTQPGTPGAITVSFAAAARIDASLLPRWHAEITLPDGQDEIDAPIDQIDGSGRPVVFTVSIPPEAAGKVQAGWRAFKLMDMPDREPNPPTLRPSKSPAVPADAAARAALLPANLRDLPLFVRTARAGGDGLFMPYGSETWLHAKGLLTEVVVSARQVDELEADFPDFRVVYYKGGRLEQFAPDPHAPPHTARYKVWTPENGGWIGILAAPYPGAPSVGVKIESAERH